MRTNLQRKPKNRSPTAEPIGSQRQEKEEGQNLQLEKNHKKGKTAQPAAIEEKNDKQLQTLNT